MSMLHHKVIGLSLVLGALAWHRFLRRRPKRSFRGRIVVLVGAGPGSPDLISVRGLNAVKEADVLVFDRLVSQELVGMARKDAIMVNVGKGPEKKRFKQSDINDILVALGNGMYDGKVIPEDALIVRLKGGDPFIFGLGGDEVIALEQAGINYQVVPGISSALAVPAAVNIPVTQKGVSTAFTVVSGHIAPGEPGAADWNNFPKKDATLVVLMGVKSLPAICTFLLANGWPEETPAAVIESGTTANERTIRSTLRDLTETALEAKVASPAIIVFGECCNVLPKLTEKQQQWQMMWNEIAPSATSWGVARKPL